MSISTGGHRSNSLAGGRRGRGGVITPLETQFNLIATYIALFIECGAVIVATLGAIQAMVGVIKVFFGSAADELAGREIWLRFATWILLALEFALAADILRTAVAPTWEDISKLAVIATIRTMLNYFLAKDIVAFDQTRNQSPQSDTN